MSTFRTSKSPAMSARIGGVGLWRALAAAPAMIGSLLLLVVLFGWLGRAEALVLLGWLASGAVVRSTVGERVAVRVGCGFRRPSPAEAAALAPLWAAAIRQSGTVAADVDLYLQSCREATACAAGARSVAVTTGLLREYQAHRLTEEQVVAVLLQGLGRHATCATRWALVAVWLATPWRVAARFVLGIALVLCRRQPRRLLVAVVCIGAAVAVVRAASQGNWLVAVVLGDVAVMSASCPLVDAAASRRAEFVADRFVADHGFAVPLVAALRVLDGERSASLGWLQRILASHPAAGRRIDALLAPQP